MRVTVRQRREVRNDAGSRSGYNAAERATRSRQRDLSDLRRRGANGAQKRGSVDARATTAAVNQPLLALRRDDQRRARRSELGRRLLEAHEDVRRADLRSIASLPKEEVRFQNPRTSAVDPVGIQRFAKVAVVAHTAECTPAAPAAQSERGCEYCAAFFQGFSRIAGSRASGRIRTSYLATAMVKRRSELQVLVVND